MALSELGEFRNGVNYSRSDEGEGLKLIKTEHIFTEGPMLNFESLAKVNLMHKSGIENYFVENGDLFFVRSYGTRQGVGYVCMAPHSDNETVHGGFIIRFRITSHKAVPLYLTYLLRTEEYRQIITTTSGGSNINNVNQELLGRLEVDLPPYNEQIAISEAIWKFDSLIENNRRRIQLLEEMARALYQEWFVHFRFPGHEDVEMVNSELGMIPEGWETRRLSEIVSTQYGYTETARHDEIGPKYVRGMDINKTSFISWDDVPYCSIEEENYDRYRLRKEDILIIRMADPGKVAIIEKDIDAIFASYLIRLSIEKDSVLPYFLFYALSAEQYQDFVSGASTGTTRKSASAPLITSYNLIVPSRSIMNKFELIVRDLRNLLNGLLDQNSILCRIRDILLPKLVSGQLDVSHLKIEIPLDTRKASKYSDQSTLDQWLDGNHGVS